MQAAVQGRVAILLVHSRKKRIEEGLDYNKVARATAGFTGAELMNLMNTAAIVAVRRGAKIVTQADVFQVRSPVLTSNHKAIKCITVISAAIQSVGGAEKATLKQTVVQLERCSR